MRTGLIVEEDAYVRHFLIVLLGRNGWSVDTVAGTEEALLRLDQDPPDVVLIDTQIDGGSGLSLLTAIKLHPFWHAKPVVMMHHGAWLGEIERALELGANDFLPKPFTGHRVLQTLDRWVIDHSGSPEWEQSS